MPKGTALTYDFSGFHDTDCVAGGANIDLTDIAETPDSTGGQITEALGENCRYWWHVRAFDGYEYSDWSPYSHFYYDNQPEPPSPTSCLYPVGDSIIYSLTPSFTWAFAYDPDPFDTVRYRLTISTDSVFQFVQTIDSLLDTIEVVDGNIHYGTRYWWKIRAYDRTGQYVVTPVSSFWIWLPGDVDQNHVVDIADLIYLVDYTFAGGPPPHNLADGDINGDCSNDVADLIYLVEYVFGAGPPPQVCGGPIVSSHTSTAFQGK